MRNKILKVKMPFWYKPFIKFMPKFWEKLPEEKFDNYKAGFDKVKFSFLNPIITNKRKSGFKSFQKAYLYARWRALWADFWSYGSETGIHWVIEKVKL